MLDLGDFEGLARLGRNISLHLARLGYGPFCQVKGSRPIDDTSFCNINRRQLVEDEVELAAQLVDDLIIHHNIMLRNSKNSLPHVYYCRMSYSSAA